MRYRVRTGEGELSFGNFLELEQAWLQGLVSPEDEVFEESTNTWRTAGKMPLLAKVRHPSAGIWRRQLPWISVFLLLGGGAAYFAVRRRALEALVTALILSALASFLTYKAFRKPR